MYMVPWKGKTSLNLLNQQRRIKFQKVQQKILEKELFYKCKEKCGCIGTCKAKGLKECTVCHEIKRSVCSKASCVSDGKKTKMLTTATKTSRKIYYKGEMDISESDEYDLEEESELEGSEEDQDDDNINANASKHLLETWSYLAQPAKESDITGKWFVGIYQAKRTKRLCIGELIKWFLDNENGIMYAIKMECLKPKVGLGTIMEDTPDHLPDVGVFNIEDVVDDPLEALPL